MSKKAEAKYWKDQAEKYEKYYKREVLLNQTYSHAILQTALSGVISSDAQRILYGMVNNEREYIYKNIK
jgi:hypothetical protein